MHAFVICIQADYGNPETLLRMHLHPWHDGNNRFSIHFFPGSTVDQENKSSAAFFFV